MRVYGFAVLAGLIAGCSEPNCYKHEPEQIQPHMGYNSECHLADGRRAQYIVDGFSQPEEVVVLYENNLAWKMYIDKDSDGLVDVITLNEGKQRITHIGQRLSYDDTYFSEVDVKRIIAEGDMVFAETKRILNIGKVMK